MPDIRSTSVRSLTAAAALALGLALIASPAGAETPSHAKSSGDAAMTEDNDTNDGGTANNVVDDGDNAHPSGKDRSVESGRSANQGNATSDPDDDGRGPDRSNGGPDKADGAGGVDQADQDGNNGCGNDDDFEDDNEGWCGKRPEQPSTPPVVDDRPEDETEQIPPADTGGGTEGPAPEVLPDVQVPVAVPVLDSGAPVGVKAPASEVTPDEVLSNVVELVPDVLSGGAVAPGADRAEVLGSMTRRSSAAGGLLARTGVELLMLAGFGAAATTAGVAARRAGRNREG